MYQKSITRIISTVLFIGFTSLSVNAETTQIGDQETVDAESAVKTTVVNIDEESFSCIRDMTPVRHFYVDNLLGDIEGTLAVANSPEGAVYPAGSVVQLVPTEVMVNGSSVLFLLQEIGSFLNLK